MKIYIGTSGWQHSEMKGALYPKNLPMKNWLSYYMDNFSTVEINTSFYHMKLAPVYKKWTQSAPKTFIFAAKLFRYITHIKRLILDEESLPILNDNLKNLSALGKNLGPILIQLPPSAKYNPERLEIFLKNITKLSKKIFKQEALFAIEFRNDSWLNDNTYTLLKKYKIAFCISDSPDWPTEIITTTDWSYIRFHGRPILFESIYQKDALEKWAERLLTLKVEKLFIYFNNTTGDAPGNAKALLRIFDKLNKAKTKN